MFLRLDSVLLDTVLVDTVLLDIWLSFDFLWDYWLLWDSCKWFLVINQANFQILLFLIEVSTWILI